MLSAPMKTCQDLRQGEVTRCCKKICIPQNPTPLSPQLAHITMPPRLRHNPITSISFTPLPPSPQSLCLLAQSRQFTTTPLASSQRSNFFNWVDGPGAVFKQADDGGPKYLSAYDKYTWERKEPGAGGNINMNPYPLNRAFKSQPVLSDQMREEIYRRVQIEGQSIRQVSAKLAVSLERVAAVVRLKAVEKEWADSVSISLFPFYFFPTFTFTPAPAAMRRKIKFS